MLIKVKYIRNKVPSGRPYTFEAMDHVEVGDRVVLDARGSVGEVVEVNVPDSEVEAFRDKLKFIVGKAPEAEDEASVDEK